jgi:hypothetical protein
VAVGGWLAAPAYLRGRIVARAAARGVNLQVSSVRVRWSSIEIASVSAALEGVEGVEAQIGTVSIPWTLGGIGSPVLRDVHAFVHGEPAALRASLDAWRDRHRPAGGEGSGARRTVRVENASLDWRSTTTDGFQGRLAEAGWDGEALTVKGGAGDLSLGGLHAHVEEADATVAPGATPIHALHATRLVVEKVSDTTEKATAEPAPKPAAVGGALWARLGGARERFLAAIRPIATGADVHVDQVTFSSSALTLGPWGVRVLVGADAVSLEVDPGPQPAEGALTLRAVLPREKGLLNAEIKFGPAKLAALGLREGSLGLSQLDETTAELKGAVELDPEAQTLAADGSLAIHGATLSDARLADAPLEGLDLRARGILASKGDLSSWTLTGGSFELGKLRLDLDGGIESIPDAKGGAPATRVWAGWTVPETSCDDALGSLPKALYAKLDGVRLSGTFAANGKLALDTRVIDKTELDLVLDQHCKVTKAPASMDVEPFKKPFELRVYDPKGNPRTATFGPGAPGWTPLSSISPYVIDAVLTCEDGAFFSHSGFSYQAIRNALLINVKAGKFMLGASTVTMQLAKNLFLDRRKLAARKLQEALLTIWLEQALGKNGIMELYLNVIEFGPNLYGIGPASWHYFGRPPSELDPLEATFLISLLPSPVKKHGMYDRGSIGEGYLGYLRTLLKAEHAHGRLDDDELENALDHELTFHKPGDPPPAPHGKLKAHGDKDKAPSDEAFDPTLAPPDE